MSQNNGCVSLAGHAGVQVIQRDPLPIEVRMLGTFDLWFGNQRVERWRAGKALSVLQYLLACHDRPVSRSTLMDTMWPNGNSPDNSLKVAVHALRSILSGWEAAADRDSVLELQSHEHSYVLHTRNVWMDLAQFENVMNRALASEQRLGIEQALPLYREATELYRGEFLCGKSEQWVVVRREQLKDLYLHGLTRLMEDEMAKGCHGKALRLGRTMLEVDACRESTYQAIMLCHGELGQPGRVMRWYEVCREVLRAELDVEPQEATTRMMARALSIARTSS